MKPAESQTFCKEAPLAKALKTEAYQVLTLMVQKGVSTSSSRTMARTHKESFLLIHKHFVLLIITNL